MNVKKIAVIGATGPSGQQVVQLALDAGYAIIALVRNPCRMTQKHDNLQVNLVTSFYVIILKQGTSTIEVLGVVGFTAV